MASNYTLNIPADKAKEMPMVDLAFELLKQIKEPIYYRDIMNEIAGIKKMPTDDINRVIAQLYTEINIDGRFACVGGNMWGLKRWYPIEKSEEGGLTNSKRPRIINDDIDDLDDELFEEEVEEDYEAPFEAEVEEFTEDEEFLPEEELEEVPGLEDDELAEDDEDLETANDEESEETFEYAEPDDEED